jgi:CPA1 family monovalent cation:H+ antiporter
VDVVVDLIVLLGVVTTVAGASRRWGLPAPLLLVLVGVAGSYIPRYDGFELDPEVVLVGLLPPLLYAASLRTSLIDLRHHVRAISVLSVALVVATTVAVGLVVDWLLPVSLAAAFAVGAVVAPPDAVAATAVARRAGLPRKALTVLEGESLFNDATALVCLRAAVAAVTGSVTALEVVRDFGISAFGGVAVGLLVAGVVGAVRKHVADSVTDTAIALISPFLAYVLAEEIHASGVLAVVVTGVLLGHRATLLQSAPSRIFERTTWATVQFLLENTVFLLIGLQVRPILDDVAASELGPGRIALAVGAVIATVVLIRPIAVFAVTYVRPLQRRRDPETPVMPWQYPTVISWASMRGVVTLAAAFALPEETPEREVLVLIALTVTVGTLLVQGFSLPSVIRRLGLAGPDPDEDALQAAEIFQRAASAGRARLAEIDTTSVPDEVVDRLRVRSIERANSVWERLGGRNETPSQAYARVRTQMLEAERAEVLRIRATGTAAHEVLQEVLNALDVEETILARAASTTTAEREVDLRPALRGRAGCEHLAGATAIPTPTSPDGCEECLALGLTWVHLRLCLDCGHVGCCDSSPHRHATAHHEATGHPVIRSFEIGEAWRWCFVDEITG